MVVCNPPSKLTLPLGWLLGVPRFAKRAVDSRLLVEHEQHCGHWEQMGQKHTERQKKQSSQILFILVSLMEDLSLSFVAALHFLLQKVQD